MERTSECRAIREIFLSRGRMAAPRASSGLKQPGFHPSHCLSHQQEACLEEHSLGENAFTVAFTRFSQRQSGQYVLALPTSMEEPKQSCWVENLGACSSLADLQIPLTVLGLCFLLTAALNKREFCILFSKKVFNTQLCGGKFLGHKHLFVY